MVHFTSLHDFLWLNNWTFPYCSISLKRFHSSMACSLFQLVLLITSATLDAGLLRVLPHTSLTCFSRESFYSSKVVISSHRVAGGGGELPRSSARHTGQSQ